MGSSEPLLALVGLGIADYDGIEAGVHLRWQFRREVGFPTKCFSLYRRPVSRREAPVLIRLPTGLEKEFREPFVLGSEDRPLRITSSVWPVLVKRHEPSGISALFSRSNGLCDFTFALPELAYHVKVEVVARGAVTLSAFAKEIKVGQSQIRLTPVQPRGWLEVEASAIERIVVQGQALAILQVSYHACERHEDHAIGHWEKVAGPICLPICCEETYPVPSMPGDKCKELYVEPECQWLNVAQRLPKDACSRDKYGGDRAKELVSLLRAAVCGDPRVPQAGVLVPGETESEDCLTEGQPAAELALPATDALLLAAIDPVVARIIGLYYVDSSEEPEREAHDYKVVGNWPEGALWLLKNTTMFDGVQPFHRFLLNFFPLRDLVFKAAIRPRVIESPSKWAGTRQALAFEKTDSTDWNFPDLENLPFARWIAAQGEPMVEIRFTKPVGEVQVFIGQRETNVVLEAWDDDRSVQVATARSRRAEDVLAVHGRQETDQITRIVLRGTRFWIYKICYQDERIAHGEHAAYAYGLKRQGTERLAKPESVKAFPLPGLVKKLADCEPLLQGMIRDARYSVGLTWPLPILHSGLPAKCAIRYHVRRVEPDGRHVLLTPDQPVCPRPVDAYTSMVTAGRKPEGWPTDSPLFTDSALGPERYRYEVAGIDIFGRVSDFATSPEVSPTPPAPPPPTGVSAKFIDSRDRWLSVEDRDLLPNGEGEAIRVTWQWPEAFARSAPDVESFRLYFARGKPNTLFGEIVQVDGKLDDERIRVAAVWDSEVPFRANLLAGRELLQGGAAFRIVSHEAADAGRPLVMVLRLPPAPSTNAPAKGRFSLNLDAAIPVDIRTLARDGNLLSVEIETSALDAMPREGLAGGTLRFRGIASRVEQAELLSGDGRAKFGLRLRLTNESAAPLPQGLAPPFTARLDLPALEGVARDYGKPDAWPLALGTIPKLSTGQIKCIIRKARAGEARGVVSLSPGECLLLLDQLPPPLDGADPARPRREAFFGVSCVGPAGEGPVAGPARVLRVFRGDEAQQAQVARDARPLDESITVKGPPRFDGTVTCEFSWKKTPGWRYEVYRALDETVLAIDRSVRDAIRSGALIGRFPNDQAKDNWIDDNFGQEWRSDIASFVVNPSHLDLVAIEGQREKASTLLQALASLPFNEDAFTLLGKAQIVEGGSEYHCEDNALPGKASGRYFYRVLAVDSVGHRTTLSRSTPPVLVQGEQSLRPPVIRRLLAEDRQVAITWTATVDKNSKGFIVYRANDELGAVDTRTMIPLPPDNGPGLSVLLPEPPDRPVALEFGFVDRTVEPRRSYFYRVAAVLEQDTHLRSVASNAKRGCSLDLSVPSAPVWTEAAREEDQGQLQIRLKWESQERLECLLMRSIEGSGPFLPITDWLDIGMEQDSGGAWSYEVVDANEVKQEARYRYQILSKTAIRAAEPSATSPII